MYNHRLDTFKAVAEEGSFNKAAEKLYITHTAVRKQIGQLEEALGVKLFDRTAGGVSLTAAGQVLYAETLTLMRTSEEIIQKVKSAGAAAPLTLRLGSSNLYPCHIFMDLWDEISPKLPAYQLKVIPFEDDQNRLRLLGTTFDFIVGPYDAFPTNSPYEFEPIGSYPFTLSVPRNHSLSTKKTLSLSDLKGQPLMIMEPGTSPVNDAIRQDIRRHYPDINVIDIPSYYDMATFNRAVETGSILLSLACWDRIHPELKSIPLREDYSLTYGMTYLKASKTMTTFAAAITRLQTVQF